MDDELKQALDKIEKVLDRAYKAFKAFDPSQERDEHGRWTSGGSGGESKPEEKPASKFDKASWAGKPVPQRVSDWKAMPVAERDKIADATSSIPAREKDHMQGLPERPSSGNLGEDLAERVSHFKDRIHPEAMKKIASVTSDYHDAMGKAGVKDTEMRELGMRAVESMATQEMEACRRQLGDHGAAHIEGNVRMAGDVLKQIPGTSPKDLAVMHTAMIFHDAGYLTEPSQSFLDEGHPRWSAEHYAENIQPVVKKALGGRLAGEVEHIIRTHDASDLDWKNDPVASACRVADNTALFRKEKLPPIFRYVPENLEVLKQVAAKKVDLDAAKKTMHENIKNSKLPDKIKSLMKDGVEEVSMMTPKFTLGMLGGEVSGAKWNGEGVDVHLKESPEVTELNKLGDFGQRQFAKFAESYGADPEKFKSDLSFDLKNKKGESVLRGIYEKAKSFLAGLMKK